MRKIIVGAQVSIDGVMQAPGGPTEDPTVPIVLGGGKQLFADGSAPHSFKLTRARVAPNGLIVAHYEREGKINIADTAPESPSDREVARRERMKREG